MKIVVKILVGILIAIAIGIGGFKLMQKIEHDQMVDIVKSEETREIIEDGLKNLDSQALTNTGIIREYELDYNSIKKNPMGGIIVTTYINGDTNLYITDTINKDTITGKLYIGGSGLSENLVEVLRSGDSE
ncbi:TPA: DUF1310 family protein [Streptococcus suis]